MASDATMQTSREDLAPSATDAIVDENDRTYHGYHAGTYFLPNDVPEQKRLDYMHSIYLMIMEGSLGKTPVEKPGRVLEIATGTGIWAIAYAASHPDSTVVGSDLSCIQMGHRQPNLEFVQHDVEVDDWKFPNPFDYIHLRYVVTCFENTKAVIQRAFDNIAPGGWIEFFDADMELVSPDDTLRGTAIEQWGQSICQGGLKIGRDLTRPRHFAAWCREVGFVDVHEEIIGLPSNTWPQDPKMKSIGQVYMANLLSLVDSFAKFISAAGLSRDEAAALEAQAKKDIQNPEIHFVVNTHIVYARKQL